MTKSRKRLEVIKQIIESQEISNQSDLIEILENKHKILSTQASVSRDLKKIGVATKTKGNKRVYTLMHKDTHQEMLKLAIEDVQYNEMMIVIHSTAGTADFVGDIIDSKELDILGCIAGENTIFVVPKSIKKIKQTYLDLCKKLYYKPSGEKDE